jgi:hypothetical protein
MQHNGQAYADYLRRPADENLIDRDGSIRPESVISMCSRAAACSAGFLAAQQSAATMSSKSRILPSCAVQIMQLFVEMPQRVSVDASK